MKYPSIVTPEYDESITVLAFNEDKARHNAVHLTEERKGKWVNYLVNYPVKNITHEYLKNTWGTVESKEHAEFIIKLAELHGLNVYHDDVEIERSFFTFNDSGKLFFYDNSHDAYTQGRKQITIPLPPKTESKAELPEAGYNLVFAPEQNLKAARNKANELRKNSGCSDELLSKAVDDAKSKLVGIIKDSVAECKEWPCVNDYVAWGDLTHKGVIKSLSDGFAWIKRDGGEYTTVYISSLKKPKTPEESLRDELHQLWDENNGEFDEFLDIAMENYNITPKEV